MGRRGQKACGFENPLYLTTRIPRRRSLPINRLSIGLWVVCACGLPRRHLIGSRLALGGVAAGIVLVSRRR